MEIEEKLLDVIQGVEECIEIKLTSWIYDNDDSHTLELKAKELIKDFSMSAYRLWKILGKPEDIPVRFNPREKS